MMQEQINRELTWQTIKKGWKNSVKCSHGRAETDLHRFYKWAVAEWAYDNNVYFVTEAEFWNGGRADIVLLDLRVAIEVVHSEQWDNSKTYPIPTIPWSTGWAHAELISMLCELKDNPSTADYYMKKYKEEMEDGDRH